LKKPVAALLLIIYLFNIGGQLALHQYFDYMTHRFFVKQAGKGLYNTGDLTMVKLPVNMSAITDWTSFEDIRGTITFENVSYNYVKMKLTRTALYLLCVPDYETTHLLHQNIINARQAGNVPVPQKDHAPYGKLAFLANFNFVFSRFEFKTFEKTLKKVFFEAVPHTPVPHLDIPEQPPRPSFC
jgi:hypothetical protein